MLDKLPMKHARLVLVLLTQYNYFLPNICYPPQLYFWNIGVCLETFIFQQPILLYLNYSFLYKRLTLTSASIALRYLIKKSNRNDFPLRNAPATETTTTFLSLTSSLSKIFSRESMSNSNVWSLFASTIWMGLALLNISPNKQFVKSSVKFNFLTVTGVVWSPQILNAHF